MPAQREDSVFTNRERELQSVEKETVMASTDALIVTMAYMLYWSYLLTCLVFPVASQSQVGATLTVIPALCGLGSMTIALIIAGRTRHPVGGKNPVVVLLTFAILTTPLLATMALSAFDIQADLLLQSGAWFLWGIAQAALFPLLGCMQVRIEASTDSRKAMPLLIASSFVGASLFCLLSLFAPDPFRSILPAIYGLTAIASLVACLRRDLAIALPVIEGLSSDFKPTASAKILSPFIVGSSFSLLVCYCIAAYSMTLALQIVGSGCLIGGLTFLIAIASSRHVISNARIERWIFPLTALCFFLISLLPNPWRLISMGAAAALAFIYACFHWSILIALARRFSISSPLHFVTGLVSPASGVFLGWAIASMFALGGGDLKEPHVLFFGWVVAYVIVISIAPYASDPLFEIDLLTPEMHVASPSDRSGNSWEKACDQLADECALSPREREVFSLLAHGRNAEYIGTALFISNNTAKTHKYRIYRKLNVSTHQELLDKVEATESRILNNY